MIMDNDQQMYYLTSEDKNFDNTIYYLVSHQEKRYCVIPKKYHKLAQCLYGVHLNCVGDTIEDKTKGYKLTSLDKYGKIEY